MITGTGLVLLVAALVPGFRFRLDPADAIRYRDPDREPARGVAVGLLTSESDRARVDLFIRNADRLPRWKWADAGFVAAGRVALRAPAGSTALLLLRSEAARGHRLDGPFVWPSEGAERRVVLRAARTAGGSSPIFRDAVELRLAGPGSVIDALCESDGRSEWQCVGVPAAFAGRIAACRDGRIAAVADVHPDSPDAATLRAVSFAALVRMDLSEPDRPVPPLSIRVLRPSEPKDFLARTDPGWATAHLGSEFVWVEGGSEAPGTVVEVRAAGHATKRFPLFPGETRCVEPISVLLVPSATLRGRVSDPEGAPVASALVLVRSDETEDPTVLADGETDANGEFDLAGLEPRSHRVRACHGEHGCAEELVPPGTAIALRLPGRGAFTGRVLSSAGVPQSGAQVRIVPTAESWSSADDRLTRLPLESRSGPDGKFRITAAENGDFLLEVRAEGGGVARIPVQRSRLSPAVADLGDVRLPEPIEFTARVSGCPAGWLLLSGPLGGETSLPELSRYRLDGEGTAAVHLPEGGAWSAWASCEGRIQWLEPALLSDAASLAGLEVRFDRVGDGGR